MWLWASAPWAQGADARGCFGVPRPPALSTVWSALTRLDPTYFEQVLRKWAAAWEDTPTQAAWRRDGTLLRGSQ